MIQHHSKMQNRLLYPSLNCQRDLQFAISSARILRRKCLPCHLQHRLGHLRSHWLEHRQIGLPNKQVLVCGIKRAATQAVNQSIVGNQNEERPFFVDLERDRNAVDVGNCSSFSLLDCSPAAEVAASNSANSPTQRLPALTDSKKKIPIAATLTRSFQSCNPNCDSDVLCSGRLIDTPSSRGASKQSQGTKPRPHDRNRLPQNSLRAVEIHLAQSVLAWWACRGLHRKTGVGAGGFANRPLPRPQNAVCTIGIDLPLPKVFQLRKSLSI